MTVTNLHHGDEEEACEEICYIDGRLFAIIPGIWDYIDLGIVRRRNLIWTRSRLDWRGRF